MQYVIFLIIDLNVINDEFQVMASKTKIYVVMEYVTGGELFNRIVSKILLSFWFIPNS